MLTPAEARQIANEWRERFSDPEAFAISWTRYMDMVRHKRSRAGLEAWLRADAEQDEVRAAGLPVEPVLPVRQRFAVDDESSCLVCCGKRYVRRDVDIDHPQFGKALPCPGCHGMGA
jgi:hypothetical protein